MLIDSYQTLRKAVLELVYDNGVINRGESEEDTLKRLELVVKCYSDEDLEECEYFLHHIPDEQFIPAIMGTCNDFAIVNSFPAILDSFLWEIFEAL